MDNLGNMGVTYADETGGRAGGKMSMLAGVVLASGVGFLGGMLLGKKRGEARGLILGMELGRTEAAAALAPRPWRRFWRRQVAA